MHVPPATDGAAVVVRERRVLVWEADGADKWRPLRTAPVLFLQLDKNCTKQTWQLRNKSKEEMVDSDSSREGVCVYVQGLPMSCSVGLNTENVLGKMYLSTPNVIELWSVTLNLCWPSTTRIWDSNGLENTTRRAFPVHFWCLITCGSHLGFSRGQPWQSRVVWSNLKILMLQLRNSQTDYKEHTADEVILQQIPIC